MEFKTLVYQFIYLATGCLSTILTQYLFYAGAAEKKTYLTVLAQYFAMTLSIFIPINDSSKKAKVSFFAKPAHIKKNIIIISLIDIFANVISTFGMFLIGSGIYQVIHSAIVVFTAILSRVFLNKKFTIQQWLSLIVITSGLSLSAIGGSSNATGVMGTIGISITIFGTICYAVIYVLNERILKDEDGPTATQHSVWVGTCSATITFVYISFFVFPKLDMKKSMMNAPLYPNSPVINIILAYVSLVLSHFLHSYTYFVLLGKRVLLQLVLLTLFVPYLSFSLVLLFTVVMMSVNVSLVQRLLLVSLSLLVFYYIQSSLPKHKKNNSRPKRNKFN